MHTLCRYESAFALQYVLTQVDIIYMLKFNPGTIEKNLSSTIGPPAGNKPSPLPCIALTS